MRTVRMSLSVTEKSTRYCRFPVGKEDKLVFLNSMVEYEVLIRSASDPPFGICNVFVYKQAIKVGVVKNN